MATIQLPPDFREFLKLLNAAGVEYLMIGGYAVGFHGYVRTTADCDVWIGMDPQNAQRMVDVLREFGFDVPELRAELFTNPDQLVRMGVKPYLIEIMTTISGVDFAECYRERRIENIDGIPVNVIQLRHLKINKLASGRGKDLIDLENLLPKIGGRPTASRRRE